MNIRLALLVLAIAAAATAASFWIFGVPGCDRTSAPGPRIGGAIAIFGCPTRENAPRG